MTGSVTVFRRGDLLFVSIDSATTNPVMFVTTEVTTVSWDAPDRTIGEAVFAGFLACERDLPEPDWNAQGTDALDALLLEAAGVKSWSTFARTASATVVKRDEQGEIKLTSMKREGGGFLAETDSPVIHLVDPTAAELGIAVRESLS